MSRSPNYPANARHVTVQKFDALTGRLIWSRLLQPPFWPITRTNTDGEMIGPCHALQIAPLHGTNDVIVRLQRYGTSPPYSGSPCSHVIARVDQCGCVDWRQHIHLGTSSPPWIPVDLAALDNGHTVLAEARQISSAGSNGDALIDFDADGSATTTNLGSVLHRSQFSLWELPTTNEVIAFQSFDASLHPRALQTMSRRTAAAATWSRGYQDNHTDVRPLCAGPDFVVCQERWDFEDPPIHAITSDESISTTSRSGLVLRDTGGSSYTYLAELDPPQSDVLADNIDYDVPQVTLTNDPPVPDPPNDVEGPSSTVWCGKFATVHDDRIYVIAEQRTYTYFWRWDLVSAFPDPGFHYAYRLNSRQATVKKFTCFDSSLTLLWEFTRGNCWGGIAADDTGVVFGHAVNTSDRSDRIERRDLDGNLVWRQSLWSASGDDFRDLCLADDGYLYVCGLAGAL